MEQRDLRFRVFNILTQEYDRDLIPSANVSAEGHFYFIGNPDEAMIEQSIGRVDKNDKMIFENDVLKVTETTGEVYFSAVHVPKESTGFWIKDSRGGLLMPSKDLCEIVGTIHDKQFAHLV